MRIFSTDHKVVGLQYGWTSLTFLLLGFLLILLIRWQLAWPADPLPLGGLLGAGNAPGGFMLPEFYNQLGAMHGTIMVFLAVVPLAVGAFGNYLIPLMIGAPDMAFPRLNMLSYWIYLMAGLVMLASFFLPGGAANSGWTAYPQASLRCSWRRGRNGLRPADGALLRSKEHTLEVKKPLLGENRLSSRVEASRIPTLLGRLEEAGSMRALDDKRRSRVAAGWAPGVSAGWAPQPSQAWVGALMHQQHGPARNRVVMSKAG